MRVLLQNTETQLFFINPNQWTTDPLKATDFEEVENAAQVYHIQDLAYARIVVDPTLPSHGFPAHAQLLRSGAPMI